MSAVVLAVVLAMLGIVLVAGVVFVYVAFPYRGRAVPYSPRLSDAMLRFVTSLPTVHNRRARAHS